MAYFMIGADGQEYGPVELTTLIQWARDGRVVPKTTLIDSSTSRRFLACDIAELTPAFTHENQSLAHYGAGSLAAGNPTDQIANRSATDLSVLPSGQFIPSYVQVPAAYGISRRSRIAAGVLGILLGPFGAHRFYLGFHGVGAVMLVLTVITCGIGGIITAPWGIIEGILCLTGGMQDAEGRTLGD